MILAKTKGNELFQAEVGIHEVIDRSNLAGFHPT